MRQFNHPLEIVDFVIENPDHPFSEAVMRLVWARLDGYKLRPRYPSTLYAVFFSHGMRVSFHPRDAMRAVVVKLLSLMVVRR